VGGTGERRFLDSEEGRGKFGGTISKRPEREREAPEGVRRPAGRFGSPKVGHPIPWGGGGVVGGGKGPMGVSFSGRSYEKEVRGGKIPEGLIWPRGGRATLLWLGKKSARWREKNPRKSYRAAVKPLKGRRHSSCGPTRETLRTKKKLIRQHRREPVFFFAEMARSRKLENPLLPVAGGLVGVEKGGATP